MSAGKHRLNVRLHAGHESAQQCSMGVLGAKSSSRSQASRGVGDMARGQLSGVATGAASAACATPTERGPPRDAALVAPSRASAPPPPPPLPPMHRQRRRRQMHRHRAW